MNIHFTNYCNTKCSFCFGDFIMNSSRQISGEKEISFKNVKTYTDFLIKSRNMHTTIIGGEPTLHHEFEKVVDYMGRRGIVMYLT